MIHTTVSTGWYQIPDLSVIWLTVNQPIGYFHITVLTAVDEGHNQPIGYKQRIHERCVRRLRYHLCLGAVIVSLLTTLLLSTRVDYSGILSVHGRTKAPRGPAR